MADKKDQRSQQDGRQMVRANEEEMDNLIETTGATREQLEEAIQKVGNDREKVERYIRDMRIF
jgi:hypothetical protein